MNKNNDWFMKKNSDSNDGIEKRREHILDNFDTHFKAIKQLLDDNGDYYSAATLSADRSVVLAFCAKLFEEVLCSFDESVEDFEEYVCVSEEELHMFKLCRKKFDEMNPLYMRAFEVLEEDNS